MNKRIESRWLAIAVTCLAFAVLFTGCPTDANDAGRSRLVINNFVGGTATHYVYVFTPDTNLSTRQAILNVWEDGWIAGGALVLGQANTFLMTRGWEGSLLMPGEWTGSGTFQVLLTYTGGELDDVANPFFRLATIVFANGSATVDIGSFAPVVTNFTVTFNSNGGSAVPTQRINIGDTATRPEDPTRQYFTFVNWYRDENLTTVYDFSTPVTHNINLFARWEYIGGLVEVTNNADSGPGSLRYIIGITSPGYTISIGASIGTIELESPLEIERSLTIEGNGVTITRSAGWTETGTASQLLAVTLDTATVTIRRVHFRGGRATTWGAAIRHSGGTLVLESCIFSDNLTQGIASNTQGGAISSMAGTLIVRGSTFLRNRIEAPSGGGGAIAVNQGTLILAGNLFHGNTGMLRPVVGTFGISPTVTSAGFNVVDVPLGTGNNQSGWIAGTGDSFVADIPVSPVSFRLLPGSGAAGVIPSRPAEYPTVDFFGNDITFPAAAGAVQSLAVGYLLTIIDNARGDVSVSPEPNVDGMHTDVTLAPVLSNEYTFSHWVVNGDAHGNDVPLNLRLTGNTTVRAVFLTEFTVSNPSDATNSANVRGTLRYAITNAMDGDTISFSGAMTVALTEPLQLPIGVTIEGHGSTLTRDASWTAIGNASQLLRIGPDTTVNISRVHFKGGRATDFGAAIGNFGGNLTIESSVFSDNVTTVGNAEGGAVWSRDGTLTVKGNTFFGNRTGTVGGGAIFSRGPSSIITLTGNLFHGNVGGGWPSVRNFQGSLTSGGFNVVDVPLGTGSNQSGWLAGTGDRHVGALPISPVTFRPIQGSGADGAITSRPAGYPTVDFNGNAITFPAVAGAIQSLAAGQFLTIEDNVRGDVSVSPEPNMDGLHTDVTLIPVPSTATANEYTFSHWLVNGIAYGSDVPLNLRLTGNTNVRAVFTAILAVTDPGDATGAALRPGTLRYALQSSVAGDRIRFSEPITAELIAPLNITGNIVIEGNGATITRNASWTQVLHNTQLLVINSEATVNISRVHFRGGRSSGFGGAIRNNGGTLILKSCIFSGNEAGFGGALDNSNRGTLIVRGSTFFRNRATSSGGAISNSDGSTLTMTGNLFHGNTAGTLGPAVSNTATVNSLGFNIVDVTLGAGIHQSGWTAATGDTTLEDLDIPGIPFNEATFAPVDGLRNVMPGTPIGDFPTIDFNGNPRTWPGASGAVNALF